MTSKTDTEKNIADAKKKTADDEYAEFEKDQAEIAARFTVTKKVIIPLLKMRANVPIYVIPTAPHFTGKDISRPGDDPKKKRAPAELCPVTDLVTGEAMQIIVSAILLSTWDDEYPDDAYVGKGFKITKGRQAEGKSYYTYSVDEIEIPK